MPDKHIKTPDGSILSSDGTVIYFSTERFVKDICEGDCCFICGASPESREFNKEHVLPRWILRQSELFNKKVTLPNETTFPYSNYTIPCCCECNSMMGREVEEPVQSLFDQGVDAVSDHLSTKGSHLLFVWLSLLFVKTHLKDRLLRKNQDQRSTEGKIGEHYEWSLLHHIHCVARSFYSRSMIDVSAFGSLMILPAKTADKHGKRYEDFDYLDLFRANSIAVRIKNFALIAVLDDACGALSAYQEEFRKFRGALSPIQVREVLARLSYINILLANRPKFYTVHSDPPLICADVPKLVELDEFNRDHFGAVLYQCCGNLLQGFDNKNIEDVIADVKKGSHTFLWDEYGNFDTNSMESL